MVNLFGKGFIGSRYSELYPCIINDRNDLYPKNNNILYFISTVDNFTFKTNPFVDIETNLITLIRVLEKCRNNNTTFNFISSWFVYGYGLNKTEESSCMPSGFYSITKRTAEELLINYAKEFNINYRILRLCNVLGKNDSKASSYKNVLTYLIKRIKDNEDVYLYNNGEIVRTYGHVDDVCNAINSVLSSNYINSIFNIGFYNYSLKDAILYSIKKSNSKSKIIYLPDKKSDSFTMNTDFIKSLGIVPKYSFYNILDELIENVS